MSGIWVSSGQITRFFGLSLIFGLFAGALFDLFRIMRIAGRSRSSVPTSRLFRYGDGLFCFIADMIYWLLLAAAYSVFIYHQSYGRLRIGALLCVGIGFLAWHYTVGRLIILAADRIIAFVRKLLRFIISITVKPLFRAIAFPVRKVSGIFNRIFSALYHSYAARRELSLADKGFGIRKIKRH